MEHSSCNHARPPSADTGGSALPGASRSSLSAVSPRYAPAAEGRWRACKSGFASFTRDSPVRWRALCGTLTTMTKMTNQFGNRVKDEDHHNSRSTAMRNAADAFICSAFRHLEDHLTEFPGAGIAGNSYRQIYHQEVLLGGARSELWRSTNPGSSRTCACRRSIVIGAERPFSLPLDRLRPAYHLDSPVHYWSIHFAIPSDVPSNEVAWLQ